MQPLPLLNFARAKAKWLLLFLVVVLAQKKLHAQCTPTSVTVSTASTVLNTYYPATSSVAAARSVITLGAARGSTTAIAQGDLLLIVQMQGSTINSTNTDAYGDGNAGSPASGFLTSVAGTYEYAIAANAVSTAGGTLYLTKPTSFAYTNQNFVAGSTGQYRYQVVRVPRYSSLTISGAGSITAAAWDGASGGVVALDVVGALSLAGTTFINVNALGFRGGGGRQLSGSAGLSNLDFRTSGSVNANGSKGEGIAGTPLWIRAATGGVQTTGTDGYPNGSNSKGAPGNAGGGATDGRPGAANEQNAGGGGGGNQGAGGRGGRTWSSNMDNGGFGGVAPSFLSTSRLILGGGGGAGSTNDGTSTTGETNGASSSGGTGGGMVMVRAGSISGTGTISADGQAGYSVLNDGGGGGGAGGTVYITAATPAGLAGITVFARGGKGGDAWPGNPDNGIADDANPEHGPGGGGGGGVVYSNAALAAATVTGGANGITTTANRTFGATAGAAGATSTAAAALPNPASPTCDTDDDNDGIADVSENRAGVDPFADADSDGVPNLFDNTPGGAIPAFADANTDGISDVFDTDVDGIINSVDLDSDNDGVPDLIEQGGTDTDNNGMADALTDANTNGWPDLYEPGQGGANLATTDLDRDGRPNFRDLDADGDGVLDTREADFTAYDTNNDGQVQENGSLGADGWNDLIDALAAPLSLPNTDSRVPANYLDIDADDDGITDNVEAQATATYSLPSGADSDLDGIDNNYDNNDAAFAGSASNGLTPNNHDGTDNQDYIDTDSDNDGMNDLREGSGDATATLTNTADTDSDGLLDQFDTFNIVSEGSTLQNNVTMAGMGTNGANTGPTPSGSSLLAKKSYSSLPDRDWRNGSFIVPVHFVKITLSISGNSYLVQWIVTDEVNVRDYTVERSIDGTQFTAVGKLPYDNIVAARKTYSYTDNSLPPGFAGTVYYRVVETGNDDSKTISTIVSQRVRGSAGGLTILGNPVIAGEIIANLSTPVAGRAVITLIDLKGRTLARKVVQAVAGNNTIRMGLANGYPANGTYFLQAVIDGKDHHQKVQVSR